MKTNRAITLYNPAVKDRQVLIEEFVVRTSTLNTILDDIKSSKMEHPEQHYLIIGQRGSGKTTLLHRIKYAIEDNSKLSKKIIPVIFTEEQYSINSLDDFWEEVYEQIEENFSWSGLKADFIISIKEGTIFFKLEDELVKHGKRLLLLVDNFNVILRKLTEIEIKKFRAILMASPWIRLIGASTSYFDDVFDYRKPFFEFFKIVRLEGLTALETKQLLLKLGEIYYEKEAIKKIIDNNPERIEVLRRLTGGIPRTVALFFQIFIDDTEEDSIKDLQGILDAVTPLYKAKMDDLSAQQQKIIDAVAKNWDAISTKEVVEKTRLASKIVSAQLRQLEKEQVIEKIEQSGNKNHLYRIQERFLNIWYLMRYGRRSDKSRVIWLVRFLEAWCDDIELEKRVTAHIYNIKKGKISHTAATLMGAAYVSCDTIDIELKQELISTIQAVYPSDITVGLKLPEKDTLNAALRNFKKKRYSKVIELIGSLETQSFVSNAMLGNTYLELSNYKEAVRCWDNALKFEEDERILYNLGYINQFELQELGKANHYYAKASKLGNAKAAHRLGHLYAKFYNDTDKAIYFFKLGIKRGEVGALKCLGELYLNEGNINKAEKEFQRGIKMKVISCYDGLARIYDIRKEYGAAERYLKIAIEKGFIESIINIAVFYLNLPNPNKVKAFEYLKMGAQKKEIRDNANWMLGRFWKREKNDEKTLKYLMLAAKNNFVPALHDLGHYYEGKHNLKKAISYFNDAYLKGDQESLLCLIDVYKNNFYEKRRALELMRDHITLLTKLNVHAIIMYATILLWNDLYNEARDKFHEYLEDKRVHIKLFNNDYTTEQEISLFLLLLIAKKQYNFALEIFNFNEFSLKDRFKPIYFALVTHLKKELPNEVLKISSELVETVDEVNKAIQVIEWQAK